MLFTVVNLARHLHVDAEMALCDTNRRFRRRFLLMEQMSAQPLEELTANQLETLWSEAKKQLRASGAES